MGTWITHLRLAENLLAQLPGLDEAAFACGSLAPDSGVPNADWTAFDPPKQVTHFLAAHEGEERMRDLRFYTAYVAGLDSEAGRARYSYVLGYFFHLLCDGLWARRIALPSRRIYPALFAGGDNQAWDTLKGDWYDLDHRYVRDHPDGLFWRVFMPAPNPPAYVPLVPDAALHRQLDYVRTFYSAPPARVLDRPYPYLNEVTLARHVADTTASTLRAWVLLCQGCALPQAETALALLPPAEVAPYEPPLGDP